MVNQHYRWDFIGLSTDDKPTPETSEKVVDGSTFYCSDTSKLYVYCQDDWYEKQPLGGGGGGTTYTAGDGIDITDDTISVDTETIQPKLTAGTNITINEDNVISAEGGSSVNVVQTTGTSTTDVMSQNATTGMVFTDPSSKEQLRIGGGNVRATSYGVALGYDAYAQGLNSTAIGHSAASSSTSGIAIGNSATASGTHSIAIGTSALANVNRAIAIGAFASASQAGEINVGSGVQNLGYNNTNYRLLTGLYDGQSAHDAVTVEQVNATIDAINTALSTNIPHIGATS